MALLLLGDPSVTAAVVGLLQSTPGRSRVSQVASLGDAMVAAATYPPALAVIDGTLCDSLEREFVDHLLRTDAVIQVLLLDSEAVDPRPPHPRLTTVPPQGLLAAVGRWMASRATAREAAA